MELGILMGVLTAAAIASLRWRSLLLAVAVILTTLALAALIPAGQSISLMIGQSAIKLFEVTSTAISFVRVVAVLLLSVTVLASCYYKNAKHWFYALVVIVLLAAVGTALSSSWYAFLVFWELATLAGYLLIWSSCRSTAKRYLLVQLSGAGVLLLAAARATAELGTSQITSVPAELYVWFMVAMGVKFGLLGLHFWLPAAHSSASGPGSAVLSGVIVKIGLFGLLKTGITGYYPLLVLGLGMIFWGGLRALVEGDIKRILAFSTISQLGFIVLSLSGTGQAMVAGFMVYVLAHGLAKVVLFVASGMIEKAAGTRNLTDLRGLFWRYPVIALPFTAATASLVGLPATFGFAAKTVVKQQFYAADITWLLFAAAVLTSLYLGRMLAIFARPVKEGAFAWERRAAGIFTAVALVIVVLGLVPLWPVSVQLRYLWRLANILKSIAPLAIAVLLLLAGSRISIRPMHLNAPQLSPRFGTAFQRLLDYLQALHTGLLNDYLLLQYAVLTVLITCFWISAA